MGRLGTYTTRGSTAASGTCAHACSHGRLCEYSTPCAQNASDGSADDNITPPSAPPPPPAPPAQRGAKCQAAAPESTPQQLHWMLHTMCGIAVGVVLTLALAFSSSPVPTIRTMASVRRPALLRCLRFTSAPPLIRQTTSLRQTTTHSSPLGLLQPTWPPYSPASLRRARRLTPCALARFSAGRLQRFSSSGLMRSQPSPRWLPSTSAAPPQWSSSPRCLLPSHLL